jgi:predicted dinucleotide-binding enzyme
MEAKFMKIGILGTGNVGRSLAKPWAEKAHEIVFGSRDPEKAQEIAESMVELPQPKGGGFFLRRPLP